MNREEYIRLIIAIVESIDDTHLLVYIYTVIKIFSEDDEFLQFSLYVIPLQKIFYIGSGLVKFSFWCFL